ncbi:N,N-dimethylformamidase beta subunit family domain-containing protein [Massilia sp. DJPM01]|uniref:N,N-dimethylformamidase beta subunit family domain-containing protein n=1 Tax=Massilia sp. DJPM01 TaxID=3024404 RepID=UPI002805CBC2|nr:N,N-dimethylformamidase beta subunit family domain-containing protein [Massilia sp. DJPM01]
MPPLWSSQGYVVQQAGHWVFAGKGLQNGDMFGAESSPPLLGYECDGAQLACMDGADRGVRLAAHAGMAARPALSFWWRACWARGRASSHVPVLRQGRECMPLGWVSTPRKGSVFTTGTTDWVQVFAMGNDALVARITLNVLEHLRTP